MSVPPPPPIPRWAVVLAGLIVLPFLIAPLNTWRAIATIALVVFVATCPEKWGE